MSSRLGKKKKKRKKLPTELETCFKKDLGITKLLWCFLKKLDTEGGKGGERPVTYFAGAAIRSSQMPSSLNLVGGRGRWGGEKQSSVFHNDTLERGISRYNVIYYLHVPRQYCRETWQISAEDTQWGTTSILGFHEWNKCAIVAIQCDYEQPLLAEKRTSWQLPLSNAGRRLAGWLTSSCLQSGSLDLRVLPVFCSLRLLSSLTSSLAPFFCTSWFFTHWLKVQPKQKLKQVNLKQERESWFYGLYFFQIVTSSLQDELKSGEVKPIKWDSHFSSTFKWSLKWHGKGPALNSSYHTWR